MCEPVSIAMAVIGVASAAAQARQAKKGAEAQSKANRDLSIWQKDSFDRAVDFQQEVSEWKNENFATLVESEKQSLSGQYQSVYEKIDQIRDKEMDELNQYSIAAANAKGTVATSAAEAETTGNSVALSKQQYDVMEARATFLAFKNVTNQVKQSERQMQAMQARSQSIINQALPGPMQPIDPAQPVQQIQSPSMAPYLIQGASSIVGAAAHYQTGTSLAPPIAATATSTPSNTNTYSTSLPTTSNTYTYGGQSTYYGGF
jgi:hypothetical protein